MQHHNSLKLSQNEARTLRAIFESGLASCNLPGWVVAAVNAPTLARLYRLGLVGEQGRLTMSGLALAASLPRAKARVRRWPLAA